VYEYAVDPVMPRLPDGDDCEAVLMLRRQPGMSDKEFERDAKAVASDLARLKKIVEERKPRA